MYYLHTGISARNVPAALEAFAGSPQLFGPLHHRHRLAELIQVISALQGQRHREVGKAIAVVGHERQGALLEVRLRLLPILGLQEKSGDWRAAPAGTQNTTGRDRVLDMSMSHHHIKKGGNRKKQNIKNALNQESFLKFWLKP